MTETPSHEPQVPAWKRHLEGLPATWPSSLEEQAADPVVCTAIRDAYEARASINDICLGTGRSRAAVRLILVQEKVLRPPGRSQRRSATLDGHESWLTAVVTALRRRIADGTYPRGSALPSVRVLSADLGVRPWAVQDAIHQLKAEGLLFPIASYGTVVTTPGHIPDLVAAVTIGDRTAYWPLPGTLPRRAELLRQAILRNLADGTYRPGPLHEVDDLAHTFALPHYLLRNVLAPLEQHGLLVRVSRRLHVPAQAGERAAALLPPQQEGEGRAA